MGMIMYFWKSLLLLAAVSLVSGCVSLYQYSAEGQITTTDGETVDAVVYWHKDEGRLWYGKKYEQLESDVTLRICQIVPKNFVLAESGHVVLQSKANDMQVVSVGGGGELVSLDSPQRLRPGEPCGLILADGDPVGTDGLGENLAPDIAILCRNDTRPDRYPRVAKYRFGAISRSEIDKDTRPAPDPCR